MKKLLTDGWSQIAQFGTFVLLVRGNEIVVFDIAQNRAVMEPLSVPVEKEQCPNCKNPAYLKNDGESSFFHCKYCGCDFAKHIDDGTIENIPVPDSQCA